MGGWWRQRQCGRWGPEPRLFSHLFLAASLQAHASHTPGTRGCLHSLILASLSGKANGHSGLGHFSKGSGQEVCGCGLAGGSWRKLEWLNIGSGNTFMLVLVSIGKKRPWGKNKKQSPRTRTTSRGPCSVSVMVTFWRVVAMSELRDPHLTGSSLRLGKRNKAHRA